MFELANQLAIGLWILVGIGLGTFVGFFFGRTLTLKKESRKLAQERDSIFRSLTQLIQSTEQMTTSVDRNNQSLATVEQNVKDITLPADFADLQARLLSSIDKVLKSNHEMENDLAESKYRLEDQAQQLDHSRKEARTDVLCDVGNRKAFKESFGSMLHQFQTEKISFGLMLIDLDHFKRVNDTYGHFAGDEVLVSVGQTLKECVRPNDIVTRIGGDEFAILLKNIDDENVDFITRRIRETMELHKSNVGVGEAASVVTTSVGVAIIQKGETARSLYQRADEALYKSKERGRNCMTTACPITTPVASTESSQVKREVNLTSILPTDTLPGFDGQNAENV